MSHLEGSAASGKTSRGRVDGDDNGWRESTALLGSANMRPMWGYPCHLLPCQGGRTEEKKDPMS